MRAHESLWSQVSRTLRTVLLADESGHSAEMKVYQFICYRKTVSHMWELVQTFKRSPLPPVEFSCYQHPDSTLEI